MPTHVYISLSLILFKRFERFGSYNGYRIGITAGGDWVFFVGGD